MAQNREQQYGASFAETLLALGVTATEAGKLTRRVAFWATAVAAPIPFITVLGALPVTGPAWVIGKSVELVGKAATKIGAQGIKDSPFAQSVRDRRVGWFRSYGPDITKQAVRTLWGVMASGR